MIHLLILTVVTDESLPCKLQFIWNLRDFIAILLHYDLIFASTVE